MTGFKKYSKSEWMESFSLDKGIESTHLVDPQIKGLSFAHQDDLRDYQGFERLKMEAQIGKFRAYWKFQITPLRIR